MKELHTFKKFLNEEEQVKEGYTPNEDQVKEAQAFISELEIFIKTAQDYINGKFDEEDMNVPSLIDDLRETANNMMYRFKSYKG